MTTEHERRTQIRSRYMHDPDFASKVERLADRACGTNKDDETTYRAALDLWLYGVSFTMRDRGKPMILDPTKVKIATHRDSDTGKTHIIHYEVPTPKGPIFIDPADVLPLALPEGTDEERMGACVNQLTLLNLWISRPG